jgi:glycyl-tRNA synthetase beta chain
MAELFIELFSEEIPARMQARGAEDLARLVTEALAPLSPTAARSFAGPRRIALAVEIAAGVPESRSSERGPRRTAPEQALAGFLRKHNAAREDLREEGDFWVLDRLVPGADAAALVMAALPGLLRKFPWPKSMRWGGTSGFTWVRPLRRITCLLDGAVVPFSLADGADDGHGLVASNVTGGHRFLSPGTIEVVSCADWQTKLHAAHVIVDAAERRRAIAEGLRDLAATSGLEVVDDPGLLDEVAGLVEWPIPMIGAIGAEYMDLPAEVMQVSMRVNQRYFAIRDATGRAAPFFAFAANVPGADGGAAIIAGNERVLSARFSDARHFWDLDRKTPLADRVAALDGITFHAKLGSQGERVRRIEKLAGEIAPLVGANPAFARRAALLAKADLTTGMVGEFPELQGIMGGYYATHDGEEPYVAAAVRDHYLPKGAGDGLPENPVGVAVALADKLDTLAAFFGVGEKPTGSGDPYALRRAALGVIRIIREARLRFPLGEVFDFVFEGVDANALWLKNNNIVKAKAVLDGVAGFSTGTAPITLDSGIDFVAAIDEISTFLLERLRVQLRTEGARHDVLNAVLGAGQDDDIVRILDRTEAVAAFLGTPEGADLLAAYRRAANILRAEEKKDGPHSAAIDPALLEAPEEQALAAALAEATPRVTEAIAAERFADAMQALAALRAPLDAFFTALHVNADRPELRLNRLRLLASIRSAMNLAADFARIEG